MKPDLHIKTIEAVLQYIPRLERNIEGTSCPDQKKRLTKSLRHQNKRLDRMIGYQFKRELALICQQAGVDNQLL